MTGNEHLVPSGLPSWLTLGYAQRRRFSGRPRRIVSLALGAVISLACPLWAQSSTSRAGGTGIRPELEPVIAESLAWLASRQQPDGSFGSDSSFGPHVGITALAGLAFMSDGHLPGRGRYGEVVEKCVRFIVANSSESGLLAAGTSHGPMYGHGLATLFLAEVYGSTHDPAVSEALHRAVSLILASQNDEGGWRYQPVRKDADISVTVCQVMALRAARNAGVHVAKDAIDRAVQYVQICQNADGGFRYMVSPGVSAFARSGAGVATLQYAGIYGGPEIEKGLQYVARFRPPQEETIHHYYYGHYYAAQAMLLAGDTYWQAWWPAVRDDLLARREAGGPWLGQAGREYGTAMALIILQMPQRLLPILQR